MVRPDEAPLPKARNEDGRRTLRRFPANVLRGAAGVFDGDNVVPFVARGVHFALRDFTDAPARSMPHDEAILSAARAGVEALDTRHAEGCNDRFYLVQRV